MVAQAKEPARLFGTDGIRGRSNQPPMDAMTLLKLGMAAGHHFTQQKERDHSRRPRVVIGKDTRLSGYMVEPALTSGFIAVGVDVMLVGPVPTPALSMLTRSLRADVGVMISASHNLYADNGVKLFCPNGLKLDDATERAIETLMAQGVEYLAVDAPDMGRAKRLEDARGRYMEYVKMSFPKRTRLDGLRIVIDCAHGAAYDIAPTILWELGADVIPVGVSPNGLNINEGCGSTDLHTLCQRVKEYQADIGIALDGDADRVIICDEQGAIADGDQLMAAIATYWHQQGRLKGGGIVGTVMTNQGLETYLREHSLHLTRTPVGDRHVAKAMREEGYNLGGEPSGHVIFNDYTTTGDGLLAALQILALLVEHNQSASTLLRVFTPWPQRMENLPLRTRDPSIIDHPEVRAATQKAQETLGDQGRVLVRPSGTEPLLRLMVEAKEEALAARVMAELKASLQSLGTTTS